MSITFTIKNMYSFEPVNYERKVELKTAVDNQ